MTGTKKEAQAIESQAIGRAYRQGQSHQVTIVRFLIKDTIEHKMYITNYVQTEQPLPAPGSIFTFSIVFSSIFSEPDPLKKAIATVNNEKLSRTMSARPNLFRSSSVATLLANSPQKSAAAVIDLIEHAPDSKVDAITAAAVDTNSNTAMQITDMKDIALDAKDDAGISTDKIVVDSGSTDFVKPDKMEVS